MFLSHSEMSKGASLPLEWNKNYFKILGSQVQSSPAFLNMPPCSATECTTMGSLFNFTGPFFPLYKQSVIPLLQICWEGRVIFFVL